MVRILVVDDFEVVRRGIVSLLRLEPEWQIAGEASDGLDAVSKAEELKCDVVVLDISLPGLNGLAVAPLIRRMCPQTEIIFVSQHVSRGMIEEALKAGARGYVSKSDAGRELVNGIRTVAQHRRFLSSSCAQVLPNSEIESSPTSQSN
jgi:DNA-binding NarL/FixJ family response regulator